MARRSVTSVSISVVPSIVVESVTCLSVRVATGALVGGRRSQAPPSRASFSKIFRVRRVRGERPDSAQGGQLRLQADHVDVQEFGLVLVLHDSYSPVLQTRTRAPGSEEQAHAVSVVAKLTDVGSLGKLGGSQRQQDRPFAGEGDG